MNQFGKRRKQRQVAEESPPIVSADDGIPPTDRRVLLRAAEYLGNYARLLAAFGTDATGQKWSPTAKSEKAEHDECLALQKGLKRIAQLARSIEGGMVALEGEDI